MTAGSKNNNEAVVLDIEQVASLCDVSENRVRKWVQKRSLKPLSNGSELVRCYDLVDFMVQYNIPIPASILPLKAKKILFIFSCETLGYIYMTFLVHFFHKLRAEENFISDTTCYDEKAKYKILTFVPDLIITDTIGAYDKALQLIKFAKKIGGFRILAIIEKNLPEEKKIRLKEAGSDAIVARYIKIDELVETIHSLFQ